MSNWKSLKDEESKRLKVSLFLINEGTAPANNIQVYLAVPPSIRVLSETPVEPKEPIPGGYVGYVDTPIFSTSIFSSGIANTITLPKLPAAIERGRIDLPRLQHLGLFAQEFYLQFDGIEPCSFSVEYWIISDEISDPVKRRLDFIVATAPLCSRLQRNSAG